MKNPRLIAVGVGPGDPELLTLKGARLLREADVVVTPVGDRSDSSVAQSIIAELVDPDRQQLLTHVYPMKKNPAEMEDAWQASAAEVAALVREGKTVVFVTLGDPFLYSTFLYLYRILLDRYPDVAVEVVPGISSINAAAAAADLPLGLAADRIAILPATFEEDKLRQTLLDFDTVVLMKVHRVFDRVRSLLNDLGVERRAVYVKRVGLAGEAVFQDLDAVQAEDLDYLSLVIVGGPLPPPDPLHSKEGEQPTVADDSPLLDQEGVGGGRTRIHNRSTLKDRRKALRNEATPAERVLWAKLQSSQLGGCKFRRQHSVGPYILDFFCPTAQLAVELDGESHLTADAMVYDRERTAYLNGLNIRVLRFLNTEVYDELDAVCARIFAEVKKTS